MMSQLGYQQNCSIHFMRFQEVHDNASTVVTEVDIPGNEGFGLE
jgi:hypothetical protein